MDPQDELQAVTKKIPSMNREKWQSSKPDATLMRVIYAAILAFELLLAEQVIVRVLDLLRQIVSDAYTVTIYLFLVSVILIFLYAVGEKARIILSQ